jgi:hypothetical protein
MIGIATRHRSWAKADPRHSRRDRRFRTKSTLETPALREARRRPRQMLGASAAFGARHISLLSTAIRPAIDQREAGTEGLFGAPALRS